MVSLAPANLRRTDAHKADLSVADQVALAKQIEAVVSGKPMLQPPPFRGSDATRREPEAIRELYQADDDPSAQMPRQSFPRQNTDPSPFFASDASQYKSTNPFNPFLKTHKTDPILPSHSSQSMDDMDTDSDDNT
jgi:hypothetical protein